MKNIFLVLFIFVGFTAKAQIKVNSPAKKLTDAQAIDKTSAVFGTVSGKQIDSAIETHNNNVPLKNSSNTSVLAPFNLQEITNPSLVNIGSSAELSNAPMGVASGIRGTYISYKSGNFTNVTLIIKDAPTALGTSVWTTSTDNGTVWTAWQPINGKYRGTIADVATLTAINSSTLYNGFMFYVESTKRLVVYNSTATSGDYTPNNNPATGKWIEQKGGADWDRKTASQTLQPGKYIVDATTALTMPLSATKGEWEFYYKNAEASTEPLTLGIATNQFVGINNVATTGTFNIGLNNAHFKLTNLDGGNIYYIIKEPEASIPPLLQYGGTYNATTNTPDLNLAVNRVSATGNPLFWSITTAGTQSLNGYIANTNYEVGGRIYTYSATAMDYDAPAQISSAPIKTWGQNTLYQVGDIVSAPMHNTALPNKIRLEVTTQFTSGATTMPTFADFGNMRYMDQNEYDNFFIGNVAYPQGFITLQSQTLYKLKSNVLAVNGTHNIYENNTTFWEPLNNRYLRILPLLNAPAPTETFADKSLHAITHGTTGNRSLIAALSSSFYCEVINESAVNHTVSLGEVTHTLNGLANGTYTFVPNQRYWIRRTSATSWLVQPFGPPSFNVTVNGSTTNIDGGTTHKAYTDIPTIAKVALNANRKVGSATITSGTVEILNAELGYLRIKGVTANAVITVSEAITSNEYLSWSLSPNTGGAVNVSTGSAPALTNLVVHSNSAGRGNAELAAGSRGRIPVSGLYTFSLGIWRENSATTRMDHQVRIFDQATNTVKKDWGHVYHGVYGLATGAPFSMYLNAGDTFVIYTSNATAGDQIWGGNDHSNINVTLIK